MRFRVRHLLAITVVYAVGALVARIAYLNEPSLLALWGAIAGIFTVVFGVVWVLSWLVDDPRIKPERKRRTPIPWMLVFVPVWPLAIAALFAVALLVLPLLMIHDLVQNNRWAIRRRIESEKKAKDNPDA